MGNTASEPALTTEQKAAAISLMREYLAAPKGSDGKTAVERSAAGDQARVALIDGELGMLVKAYLSGAVPLSDFKSKADGINKRNELWGFKGIKGQMFFNLLVNASENDNELDQELKAALAEPTSDTLASSRLKNFESFVMRLGKEVVESGASVHSAPKPGSIPFFVSYFWQIQNRNVWPVYYTNAVQMLADHNLWQPRGVLADDYISFKRLNEELAALFSEAGGRKFTLYDVEHVFWFKGGNPYEATKEKAEPIAVTTTMPKPPPFTPRGDILTADKLILPESYVPPVISVLPVLARNDAQMAEAAKRAGTSIDRAFEKSVHAAFTILGYEAKLLGQGKGRVPDGIATAHDQSYVVLWDAKVRVDGYSMGTDDRVVRDYVTTQSRDLKRRSFMRNIYYVLISSSFSDDYEEPISSLKMETDVNEVILLEASALVAMVDAKLHEPLRISLGPDGLQRLFTGSRVLTAEGVRGVLN